MDTNLLNRYHLTHVINVSGTMSVLAWLEGAAR